MDAKQRPGFQTAAALLKHRSLFPADAFLDCAS
jgi:hypothetical protein